MGAFVFPDEVFAEEDIGEAFGTVWFGGLGFKGKVFTGRIVGERGLVADEVADVVKVLLGNGRFFLLNLGPLGDEFFGGHCFRHKFPILEKIL